jgi:hypothetical protein
MMFGREQDSGCLNECGGNQMGGGTLFEALQSIPDHRTKKGTRFPLAAILAIAIAAMLSGANDLMAIFRWSRRLSAKALQALGVDKKRIPGLQATAAFNMNTRFLKGAEIGPISENFRY